MRTIQIEILEKKKDFVEITTREDSKEEYTKLENDAFLDLMDLIIYYVYGNEDEVKETTDEIIKNMKSQGNIDDKDAM